MFKKKPATPSKLTEFPTGTCVKSGENYFYINKQFKHKIASNRILMSWAFPFVIEAKPEVLKKYKNAKPLGFRPGTIVKSMADGKFYYIVTGGKMHIQNPDFIKAAGVKIMVVSAQELALHVDAGVIN